MFSFTRRRLFATLALLSLPPLSLAGLALWAGWQIASPPRRSLQDYHREFLARPGDHGLTIRRFTTADRTPCLICEPAGTLAKRGTTVREQLAGKGIALAKFGEIRGTLVLLHGRCGRKEDYLPIAERLCACGFRCLIPDLPGHGDHPAEIATYGVREAELPERLLQEASEHFGFPQQPAGLLGMSMGGSVAMHAASRDTNPWQALVILSSFDSLAPVLGQNTARQFGNGCGPLLSGGAAWIYQQRAGLPLNAIRPDGHASRITIPTLIAHGTGDRVISLSAGRRLYEALPGPTEKQWIEVPGADHDNVLITDFPIYQEVAAWMLRHVGTGKP